MAYLMLSLSPLIHGMVQIFLSSSSVALDCSTWRGEGDGDNVWDDEVAFDDDGEVDNVEVCCCSRTLTPWAVVHWISSPGTLHMLSSMKPVSGPLTGQHMNTHKMLKGILHLCFARDLVESAVNPQPVVLQQGLAMVWECGGYGKRVRFRTSLALSKSNKSKRQGMCPCCIQHCLPGTAYSAYLDLDSWYNLQPYKAWHILPCSTHWCAYAIRHLFLLSLVNRPTGGHLK